MNHKKTSYPPINLGTSLMLVIFIILAMVIFAVLSLAGAIKDKNSSTEYAARVTAYYEACNEAERIRAELISNPNTPDVVEYAVIIDEDEILRVELTKDSHGQYQITSWVREITAEWNSEQTLPVLGSEP